MPKKESSYFNVLSCSLIVLVCLCSSIGSALISYGISTAINSQPDNIQVLGEETFVKNNGFDWIFEDSEEAKILLADAQNHFEIKFDVDNETEYRKYFKSYENFILANMGNQYRNLTNQLNIVISNKVIITILDTPEKYKEKSGFNWEGDLSFSGFADYNYNIFVLIPKDELPSRDTLSDVMSHELVHTFYFSLKIYNSTIPTWFTEGMAEYYSTGGDTFNYKTVRKSFPDINSVSNGFKATDVNVVRQSYVISQYFYQYLVKFYPDQLNKTIRIGNYENFNNKFAKEFGKSVDSVYAEFLLYTEN